MIHYLVIFQYFNQRMRIIFVYNSKRAWTTRNEVLNNGGLRGEYLLKSLKKSLSFTLEQNLLVLLKLRIQQRFEVSFLQIFFQYFASVTFRKPFLRDRSLKMIETPKFG